MWIWLLLYSHAFSLCLSLAAQFDYLVSGADKSDTNYEVSGDLLNANTHFELNYSNEIQFVAVP